MVHKILRLNKAGQPLEWLNLEEAACVYAKEQVLWSLGDTNTTLHGGISRLTGRQSLLPIANIIATSGSIHSKHQIIPPLSNDMLFLRERMTCLYCGQVFSYHQLTRDHVIPRGQKGRDTWNNCVAACRPCNHKKGCRTPEQAGMPLLAVPFKPNKAEYLALANRRILGDQMDFLKAQFSDNRIWS